MLRRRSKTIEANFQSGNKATIQCKLNNVAQICCLDSGAHNSIISAQVFSTMNIDHVKLCTRQTYNIQTATSLEKDAIQGSIVLYPVVYNADKTTQNLRQHFLVLRPSHSLSTPLLGVDFLTNNQVFMNFKDSNFVVQVNGIKLSLSQTNPTMTEERFLPTYNADVKSSVKSGSTRSNPPNHFLLSGSSAVTITEFNAFVRQNRMEKLSQAIRQDKKYENAETIDIHQAILQDYEEQFGNLLQRHSMMPNEDLSDNPELKVDLDHLSPDDAEAFSVIQAKYPGLYSTHKHHVRLLTGWAAKAIIDPSINCKQKKAWTLFTNNCQRRPGQIFQVWSFCPINRRSRFTYLQYHIDSKTTTKRTKILNQSRQKPAEKRE